MTDCNPHSIAFPHCKGGLVEASFSGGAITSDGAPQWLYDRVYCARGDMENRILTSTV